MLEASRLLFTLAEQFESQHSYAQAVKCLTPICGKDSEELPSVVALARLRLASLLLSHFDNFHEAKSLLLTAEQELRQMQGNHLLKCEVWDALARCNQKLGSVAAEREALASGLKACRHGATSKDKDALARWRSYFHFKLAEHSMDHQGPEEAAEQLQELENDAHLQLPHAERVLQLLCRATLHLCAGEVNAASAVVEQINPLVEAQAGREGSLLDKQLRCHYNILYVSMVVAAGRINDLKQDPSGNITMLVALQKMLAEMQGGPWAYSWLPPPAVGAVGNLLHASLLRSLGKAAPAAAYLSAAAEVVEQQLLNHGINLAGGEAELGMQAIWEGRIYCHLQVLVVEQQVLVALLASRFAHAAELLGGLTALLDRYPSLLRDFAPSTRLLLGHYAHSVQQYTAASAHFQAVLLSDAVCLHDSAAVAAALAELHADGGPAGLRRAVELLQQRGISEMTHMLSLPVHDRTAALVTNALASQQAGDDSNARLLLTKALKTAHSHLGNTQMVAQVLNMLAPIQFSKGDLVGAEQMLGSATTLSKAQGDLPTLVTASRALVRMFASSTAHDADRRQKQQEYTQRKAADLQGAIAAAAAVPGHAALLAWSPTNPR